MSRKIITTMKKAITEFDLISEGDVICVGISGGKDSMALVYALNQYRKFALVHFTIVAINLDMGFNDMDFRLIGAYLVQEDIEFHQVPTQIFAMLDGNRGNNGQLKCSLCSKFKKALIIDAAKNHNCTKIAFAHHADDAIETLFLNAIHGGKLATFPPKLYLSRSDCTFIRPFVYVREKEIESYIVSEKIPIVESLCPNEGITQRNYVKDLLAEIYISSPTAYKNFLIMLSNQNQLSIWKTRNIK